MLNTNRKIILIIILILGVFVMPNNFIKDIIQNANELIKYKNTVTTGEITVDNGDGTYDVKIANAGSAYPDVETINYDAVFGVGEIVDIIFEHGCKESPKIIGHSKKIKQEPEKVEVDYSGEIGGGKQTETTIIYIIGESGCISLTDTDYDKCHNTIDGSDLSDRFIEPTMVIVGQSEDPESANYGISRGFVYFDTSLIPSNATITNAILSITISEKYGSFNIVIQDGQPNYPHSSIDYSDVNYLNYYNNGGQMTAVAAEVPPVYSNIVLNANGRNWINKGGITKFCLRSSKDIISLAPAEGITDIVVIDKVTYPPKLIITYEI